MRRASITRCFIIVAVMIAVIIIGGIRHSTGYPYRRAHVFYSGRQVKDGSVQRFAEPLAGRFQFLLVFWEIMKAETMIDNRKGEKEHQRTSRVIRAVSALFDGREAELISGSRSDGSPPLRRLIMSFFRRAGNEGRLSVNGIVTHVHIYCGTFEHLLLLFTMTGPSGTASSVSLTTFRPFLGVSVGAKVQLTVGLVRALPRISMWIEGVLRWQEKR